MILSSVKDSVWQSHQLCCFKPHGMHVHSNIGLQKGQFCKVIHARDGQEVTHVEEKKDILQELNN